MHSILIPIVYIILLFHNAFGEIEETETQSIQGIYTKAVEAYSSEKWIKSVKLLESTIVQYKMLQHMDANCRERCLTPNITKELHHNFTGFKDLEVYGNFIIQANCIKVCREGHPYSSQVLEYPRPGIRRELDNRKIYDYLQYAYYRTGRIKKACQAAYTYLQKHPESEHMQKNLEFYKELQGETTEDFKDLEAGKYEELYLAGATAYDDKDYKTAVVKMEEFFVEYYKSFHECNLLCYRAKAPTHTYRLHQATAARYHQVIDCMLHCEERLAPVVGGYVVAKVVPRAYSYLQFSYFYTSKYQECVSAAASEFLLDPDGENAKTNMKFYKEFVAEKQLKSISFEPRPDALEYHQFHKILWELIEKTTYLQDYDDEAIVLEDEEEDDAAIFENSDLVSTIVEQISQTLSDKLVGELE